MLINGLGSKWIYVGLGLWGLWLLKFKEAHFRNWQTKSFDKLRILSSSLRTSLFSSSILHSCSSSAGTYTYIYPFNFESPGIPQSSLGFDLIWFNLGNLLWNSTLWAYVLSIQIVYWGNRNSCFYFWWLIVN